MDTSINQEMWRSITELVISINVWSGFPILYNDLKLEFFPDSFS